MALILRGDQQQKLTAEQLDGNFTHLFDLINQSSGGATGPAGATGPQGPQGAVGATGPQGATGPGSNSIVDEIIEIEMPYFLYELQSGLDEGIIATASFSDPLLRNLEGQFTGFTADSVGDVIEIEPGIFLRQDEKTYTGLFELIDTNGYSTTPTMKDFSYTLIRLYFSRNSQGPFTLAFISTIIRLIDRFESYDCEFDEEGNAERHNFRLKGIFDEGVQENQYDQFGQIFGGPVVPF